VINSDELSVDHRNDHRYVPCIKYGATQMTVRASIVYNTAWLGKDFGRDFAIRQFGQEIVDALPRYVKGKNAGNHKASIEWIKVAQGGWVSHGAEGVGHVERRVGQVIAARLVITEFKSGDVTVLHEKGEANRFRKG
jgi:hypothetical protein